MLSGSRRCRLLSTIVSLSSSNFNLEFTILRFVFRFPFSPHYFEAPRVEVLDVEATEGDGGKNGKKRKLPPRPKLQSKDKKPSTRTPAKCWAHFEKIYEGGVLKWGECKYCKKRYAAETQKHGTSNLKESKGRAAGEAMEKRVTEIMRRLYDAYANASDVRVEAPRAMPSAMMTDDSNDPRLSLASRFKTFLEEECAGKPSQIIRISVGFFALWSSRSN
ncbi:hypothetical protein Vadar_024205 [Vaccinium darrowii]|uniref:Uncharacterized protein n=1 Tax=Vaccinium darrowii TaxID=229202 RepID=A0ACB7XCC0_9ERIC|nr:hypothetical protein Vadar_024205 [Vaccinium darrowii]